MSSAEPFKQFNIFCRDNRYRCPLLNESRSTTAARTTSNVGACPVVPPTRAVTNNVNRLLTLSCICSEELDFSYNRVSLGHEQGPGPRWYPPVHPFRYNPCVRTVGSPDSLPSRTLVGSGSYQQMQPGGVTLGGTLEMVRQRHQWN